MFAPPPSNRGCTKTKLTKMNRNLPDVTLSPCSVDYALPVAQGWDYWQEALRLEPHGLFCQHLDRARAKAESLKADRSGMVEFPLGREVFKLHATGAKGGTRWRLENDDFLLLIGSPKREWTISVRYLAAGLWEHGIATLRERVLGCLHDVTRKADDDFIRVSRVDWCWDYFSPAFSDEFTPALIAGAVTPSATKQNEKGALFDYWGNGGKGQTLTLGSYLSVQVQVYDKTREIIEASGKEWLYKIWREGAGFDFFARWLETLPARERERETRPRHVWRVEARWSAEFLKDRNVRRAEEVLAQLPLLIAEALYTRRLALPTSDKHRDRWPLHPLWSECVRASAGGEMLSRGRMVTGRRSQLYKRAVKQIAGAVRSATVLDFGEARAQHMHEIAEAAVAQAIQDEAHATKEQAAQVRYSTVDDAR